MVAAYVSEKHQVLVVPFQDGIANILPNAKRLPTGELVVPHKADVVRLLKNFDVQAPAPILSQYKWANGKPFETQKKTAAMLTMNRRAYVLSEMGTGKTRATLYAFDFLRQQGDANKLLIVAPLSTLTFVWQREIFRYFPHLSTAVLHGTKKKRVEALQQDADVYIINHDGLAVIREELAARTDIDVFCIDELAAFRNAGSKKWKVLAGLLVGRKFAWGLTGSPTPNDPTDAYGQVKLLTPERVPKFYGQFRNMTMLQVSQFKWVARPHANDVVFKAMQPSVRFTRDECVELPPCAVITREVEMTNEQARAYKLMLEKCRVDFAEGRVTAVNEGVKLGKIMQVALGWVYTDKREIVTIDNAPRIEALREVIDEAEGKVIVFVDYIHAANALYKSLSKELDCALVHGDTPKSQRDDIFTKFQSAQSPRVLVAHPKCMAHGLTLTAANVIVWFSPTQSLELYEQANARVTRPGQTRKQLIVHLTNCKAESKVYGRLEKRQGMQNTLLELFEEE